MAQISSYPIITAPALSDLLIGTDVNDINNTKNFRLSDIAALIGISYVPYVGALGNLNMGLYSVQASAFIVNEGLSSQFLKADGTLDSTAYVPEIRTVTINGVTYDLSEDREWDLPTIDSLTTVGTGGSSTYTNKVLNIPIYQQQGDYITQLSGEATALGPGNASITLDNNAVISKILSGLNITGGNILATDSIIEAFGKVQNQINSLVGGVQYRGTWDASTNTPTLQSSVGNKGDYYIVSVAGTTDLNGISDWNLGDWVIYDGSSWEKVDNTDAVVSVNGYTGAVELTYSDVNAAPAARVLTINGIGYDLSADRSWVVGDVRTDSFYANPSWITSLSWSKITSTPTTLGGYGISDAVSQNTTLTINGISYDLSSSRTWSVGTVTSISTSGPLTGGTITGTGTIGITKSDASTNGYLSSVDWTTFNAKQNLISWISPIYIASDSVGIYQSGISSDGFLSSVDWNTFNNKQDLLINPVTGTGTAYTIPMWSGLSMLTDSPITYLSNTYTFNYNSTTGASVVFLNNGTTPYAYTVTMNNYGSPRITTHSYTDGVVSEIIGSNQVRRSFSNGNTIFGLGTSDTGYKVYVEGGLHADYVTLSPLPATIPTAQGSLYFDAAEQTVAAILNGSTMKIGEDSFYQIKNQTGATIPKGTALRFDGVLGSSGRVLAVPFLADGTYPSLYFLGVAYEDIPDGGDGKALAFGKVRGINTNAYPAGTILYASTTVAGGYQTTAPIAPNNIIVVAAVVIQGVANGAFLVRPTLGSNINNDEGVKIVSPVTGDILQLQANGLWENKTVSSLGLVPQSRMLTVNGTAYDLSADRAWSVGTITSLTGEATASGSGAVAVTLDNGAVTGKLLTGLNITGGTVVSTDSILTAFGKVQNELNGLIGGSVYQGTWDANTNTPALISSVGTRGHYYIVSVAGTTNLNGVTDWQIGDWAIYDGSSWQKVDNTDAVVSVNGYSGNVSLVTGDILEGAGTLPGRPNQLYFTDARSRSALSFVAGSGGYDSLTGIITIPTNTSQLTNGANYISLTSLSASGPLSYNDTTGSFTIQQASGVQDGYISLTDWNTFNNKVSVAALAGYVPTSRTLTINGTSYDLTADRSWTIPVHDVVTLGTANGLSLIGQELSLGLASSSDNGALSSSDWNTFNSKIGGSGTNNYLSLFNSSNTLTNSILEQIGNAIHLTNAGSSYASFGINNPGVDNDAYIGSTINNDFLIKINNTEAIRIDTAFRLKIANIQNITTDTDRFLVSDNGIIKYRTGSELLSDIEAVPNTRTLTINGTTYDLTADRSWTITSPSVIVAGTGTGSVKRNSMFMSASGYYSGSLSGGFNSASGACSVISGGYFNNAFGGYSAVSGGYCNKACSSGSFIGSGKQNTASAYYATVVGGCSNTASGEASFIGGGAYNLNSGQHSTIGGGYLNQSFTGYSAFIGGGIGNIASGDQSVVVGGGGFTMGPTFAIAGNCATGNLSFVGGGRANKSTAQFSSTLAGYYNTASAPYSFVAGGYCNTASAYFAGVYGCNLTNSIACSFMSHQLIAKNLDNGGIGGCAVCADFNGMLVPYTAGGGGIMVSDSGYCSTIRCGVNNCASGNYSFAGGGSYNTASGYRSFVGGGTSNTASAYGATVAGGCSNTASGSFSGAYLQYVGTPTIGGGLGNTASARYTTIGGGKSNTASQNYSTVSGGYSNSASGYFSTISGGQLNTVTSNYAFVGGGYGNIACGNNSFIGGGSSNCALESAATATGGANNSASGACSFVGGGKNNIAGTPTSTLNISSVTSSSLGLTNSSYFNYNISPNNFSPDGTFATQSGYYFISNSDLPITICSSTLNFGSSSLINPAGVTNCNVVYTCFNGSTNSTYFYFSSPLCNTFTIPGTNNSFVGGGYSNTSIGTYSAIGGGGSNIASTTSSTVSGGYANKACGYTATVSGGFGNTASGAYSTIGGGEYNIATADGSTVGGGCYNSATGSDSTVSGGRSNVACGSDFVGGGSYNIACGGSSVVVGGDNNRACGYRSIVVGGTSNWTRSFGSVVVGGVQNVGCCTPSATFIGGGCQNIVAGLASFIGGGVCNTTLSNYGGTPAGATVAGGIGNNTRSGVWNTVCCVWTTAPTKVGSIGAYSFVGGGFQNQAEQNYTTVAGGFQNRTCSAYAAVLGGRCNCATGSHSAVLGGQGNSVSGSFSGAFGFFINNSIACSFAANQLWACNLVGTAVNLCVGTNGVIVRGASDCRLKTNICTIDYGLCDINKLNPVSFSWNACEASVRGFERQLGFIAQEVEPIIPEAVGKAAEKDEYSFSSDKIIPVLTKAIQELSAKNISLEDRISKLEQLILNK